jgi:hypothetical protein
MTLIEAYFDESCTNKGDPVQCVAGYVFESNAARAITEEWTQILQNYDLEHFHMVDCVHRNEQFKKYRDSNDKLTADKIAREFIELIKKYKPYGISVIYSLLMFGCLTDSSKLKDKYSLYAESIFIAARAACEVVSDWDDPKINFRFEQGHDNKGIAQNVLSDLLSSSILGVEISEVSFEAKSSSPLLQAADILAYHSTKHLKRWRDGSGIRKDFASLMEIPHLVIHLESLALYGFPPQPAVKLYHGSVEDGPAWDEVFKRLYGRSDEIVFSLSSIPLWNHPGKDRERLIIPIPVN